MERRRRGFALAAVLLIAVLAGSVLLALSPLERSVARDLDFAQLEQEVTALANSRADELALKFARIANDRTAGGTYYNLRLVKGGLLGAKMGEVWWGSQQAREEALEQRLEASEKLLERLTAGKREHAFDAPPPDLQILLRLLDGAPEPTIAKCEVAFLATVTGRSRGRTVRRTVVRVQGMKVSRLGLPWPYDALALFVREPRALLKEAPRWAAEVGERVIEFERALEPVFAKASSEQKAAMQGRLDQLHQLVVFFSKDGYGIPTAPSYYYTPLSQTGFPNLRRIDLSARIQPHYERLEIVRFRLARAIEMAHNDPSEANRAAMDRELVEFLTLAKAVKTAIQDALDGWMQLPLADASSRIFHPGIETLEKDALWGQTHWFKMKGFDEFACLTPTKTLMPTARNGVLFLAPDKGRALVNDETVWGGAPDAAGRLVVVTYAETEISNVHATTGSGRALVTVVARKARVTISGNVEANIVACSGLKIEANAHIKGNVVVLGGPIDLGDGASIERDAATHRKTELAGPVPEMYHVAMDPFLITRSVN